ncbi:MAG: MurR/RpiR family transcriptional regulator [Oscillospiraceae bacterium]|nr:MurR/RpiR family transcriptional regulator [Oscillospiraceae bacterium]
MISYEHDTGLLNRMRQIKDLSPSERHIVDFIFSNLQEVSNMGIVELGEKTFTSTTTVKRLCRKLGIDSYTDFRLKLSAEIANYARINIIEGAQAPVDRYDTVTGIIRKVSDQNAKSIIDTSNLNHPDVISDVIALMTHASRIDFYGIGPSNVVAEDAQLKCMRLGIPSTAYGDRLTMLINALATPHDALAFMISYTGETEDVIEAAATLKRAGVTTVSLTSLSDNRLIQQCTYNLFVQSSESWDRLGGMSSRISTLNLIDILFTALINTDHEHFISIMQHTNVSNRREVEP